MPWTFYNSSGEAMIQDGGLTIANNTNNYVVTATGVAGAALNGESGLTFNGTHLTIADGDLIIGTAGHGIDFSAQASPAAGMTSELLDRYEEGTFTPTLTDGTNTATNHAHMAGSYTRIGRLVHIQGRLRISSLGSVSGNISLGGIPFTPANTSQLTGSVSVSNGQNLNVTAGYNIGLEVLENTYDSN